MPSIQASDLLISQKLLTGFKRSEDMGYMNAAVMTILLYDIFTTIVDEVDLIWRDRWSITKVLYLIARYYPAIFTAGGYITFSTMVNIVFVMRIHALYRRSWKVLIFFTALCFAEFGVEFYISWVVSQQTANSTFEAPIPGWRGCLSQPISVSVLSLAAWCMCAGVAFTFFAFTIYKLRDSLRDDHGRIRLDILREQKYFSPIVTVLMRDGAIFFFIIFATLAVNAVLTAWRNSELGGFGLPWVPTAYSLVGSHMVLDLKKAGGRGDPTRITGTVTARQDVIFARPCLENPTNVGGVEGNRYNLSVQA
ncbi:hypothetical protein NLJ89_g4099 [Agrocybe chaxingu]|uniref:DUF6533 domain-containing protein n=1 Tax=Agrocybe chaxingu TaxID=84603 RepID=A0A9W8K953_9AGAR|nr:hypothetical protein NLJ89_g4099 [Agrocybe chaxingu]